MLVIAVAGLVIEAEHAALIGDIGQAVLEDMSAARKWLRKLPNHNHYERATTQNQPFTHKQLGFHVAYDSNSKILLSIEATGGVPESRSPISLTEWSETPVVKLSFLKMRSTGGVE